MSETPTTASVTEDAPAEIGGQIGDTVGYLFKCKEIRKALKKEFENKDERYKVLEGKLSVKILSLLSAQNLENARTPYGTVFPVTTYTASLSAPEEFMKYVIDNGKFDLLDRKANMTAVKAFVRDNGGTPPGCNLTAFTKLGAHRKVGSAGAAKDDE